MSVYLNGEFVAEARAQVSVFDRCFLYGDGLFEALRVHRGKVFRANEHWLRLQRGAEFLKISLPETAQQVSAAMNRLIAENSLTEGVIRITLSRGVGIRGYSPRGADKPILVISTHPLEAPKASPDGWKLVVSSFRVPAGDLVAMHKTCNKLHNVLARAEAEARRANEALILNSDGIVAEATSSNLFWIENDVVHTTPIAAGLLPGVTRDFVIQLCGALKVPVRETKITPEELNQAAGVFLTLSTLGIVEVLTFENHTLSRSSLVQRLKQAYDDAMQSES